MQGLTLSQAVEKMRGPINTEVKLRIERPGRKDMVEVTLMRSNIVVPAVRARVEADDIAYIRITTFSEQTFDGLKRNIEKLTADIGQDKLKGFIIDLRNNRGGRRDQAVLVSDAFLERGEIVSTRGRNVDESRRYDAKSAIHQGQAGCRADQWRLGLGGGDRCRRDPGSQARHGDGHALLRQGLGADHHPARLQRRVRLTTARYYTPSGRSIQAKGIDPDVEVLQDVPEEIRGKDETKGEAGLKGHLSNGGKE